MPVHVQLVLLVVLLLVPPLAVVVDYYAAPPPPRPANGPLDYIDPTYPTPAPPPATPSCTVHLLQRSFNITSGHDRAIAGYKPPEACPAPWRLVVLSLSGYCTGGPGGSSGNGVAAVWLDGVVLLRTATPPASASGSRWALRKDVSRLVALLRAPPDGVVYVAVEDLHGDKRGGECACHVNASLEFYNAPAEAALLAERAPPLPESYFLRPADSILPVSDACDADNCFWFRIKNASDVRTKAITVPRNTYRAVLEVFVSHHGDDELWFSNPPDTYIRQNNLTTRSGNAAYREVVITVDRRLAGSFVPFPLVLPEAINPLLWQPVVAIGAFDVPSYDIELTPFLGLLLDGKPHEIGIGILDGIPLWLVDANLHLWLDLNESAVSGHLRPYKSPRLSLSRRYMLHGLDGRFEIGGKRKSAFTGWVKSSFGNFTMEVDGKLTLDSLLEFADGGKHKTVQMTAKRTTKLRIWSNECRVVAEQRTERVYPLSIDLWIEGGENATSCTVRSNLSHALHYDAATRIEDRDTSEQLADVQHAYGWMQVEGPGRNIVNGSARTSQAYKYCTGDGLVYERMITTHDGSIMSDNTTESHEQWRKLQWEEDNEKDDDVELEKMMEGGEAMAMADN